MAEAFTSLGYTKQLEEACAQRLRSQGWQQAPMEQDCLRRQARALERIADALEKIAAQAEPQP